MHWHPALPLDKLTVCNFFLVLNLCLVSFMIPDINDLCLVFRAPSFVSGIHYTQCLYCVFMMNNINVWYPWYYSSQIYFNFFIFYWQPLSDVIMRHRFLISSPVNSPHLLVVPKIYAVSRVRSPELFEHLCAGEGEMVQESVSSCINFSLLICNLV